VTTPGGAADRELSVGLIGYGISGAAFHAPLISATPGLRLAAVVTRDMTRADQARRDHPGVRIWPGAEALFAATPAVDVIVIASPNRTHVPLARASIRAGIPVVVEKPMAPTVGEAAELVEEARERGVLLTVYQNRRWDGDFLTVRRLLSDGALGQPLRFESRFDRWRPAPKPGWRESGAPEDAGGLLFDLGSHLVDQAVQLFGPVEHVYRELDCRRPGVSVDDDVFVALTHRSGVRSHVWASVLAAQQAPRMRVLGSRAAYTKYGMDVQETALRAGIRPGPGWGEEPEDRWGVLGVEGDLMRVRTEAGDYPEFYRRLRAALRGEGPPPVDPSDAVEVLRLLIV
jgi:predicted dehydrogenase